MPVPNPPALAGDSTSGALRLVNAHTHIYSGLAPLGMPPPEPAPANFVQILERVWWRLDRALDERALRASARLYVAEALLHGTTVLIDHHESPSFIAGSLDVLADACQELGMRALLCYGATERNGGVSEARRGLAECRRFLRDNRRSLVRGCVGLHASFTVSDETVRAAGELARELHTIVHVHLAEDLADVEDARARGWPGPLERLHALGALPAGSILAHGVHLDAAQVGRARDLGLWLVQNPRSNHGNRVGYPAALAASERVALGTDGYPADMGEELASLFAEGCERGEAERQLAGRLAAGAQLATETLGLEAPPPFAGSAADLSRAVRAEQAARRARTLVAGRTIVENGVLQSGDLEAIRAEAREEAARLWHRMGEQGA